MGICKTLFKVICVCVCFSLAGWFCRKQTDGFTILKISSNLSYHTEWETPHTAVEKTELLQIFKQPFTYLAKGDQCFVFVSEDRKYVLKFFRQSHMRAPFWVRMLPYFMQEVRLKETLKRESKLTSDFLSYRIAFDELKEETGLVFLHLNKTDDLKTSVTVVDKLHIAHQISLDTTEFLVQKCAKPLYPAIEEMILEGKIDAAKATLAKLVQLLLKVRYEKGIADNDPDLNTNFGCIGDTPVQIDVGRFKKSEMRKSLEEYQMEIAHITDNLHQWLECRSTILDECLREEIVKVSQGSLY